jgi:DNA polymerase-1
MPSLTHDGIEVGALFGFCSEILKIIYTFKNSKFIAALDSSKKTFRNDIYEDYKANRKSMPAELVQQLPMMREACKMFGFVIAEREGFEADDVIASMARLLHESNEITVVSADKDLMQLLTISGVSLYNPTKSRYVTDADSFKKFGVCPEKILDVMSLMGDSSDGVPGIPGVGQKTAASLINEFGSLDGLLSNLDSLPNNKKNDSLKSNIHLALLSRDLISLRYDIRFDDLQIDVDSRCNTSELSEFFMKYGFKTLSSRLADLKL